MQATQQPDKQNTALSQLVTVLGIGAAILLFVVVIGQMGLFNRLVTKETAVPQAIALTTQNMAFGLNELHVKAGELVTVQLDNYDVFAHSFDIDEWDVHVDMPGNDRAVATFVPTTPGQYSIYCRVPGHREAGMIGTLIVEP